MRFQEYEADTCINLRQAWGSGEIELEALTRLSYPGRPMPPQMLKKVNAIGYWDAHTQQHWGLDWHRNEGLELTFLETGSLTFAVEGQQEIILRANDLTITRPWQMHRLGNPFVGVGKLYWIILDVEISQPHQMWKWPDWIILSQKDLEELTIILRQNEQPVWHSSEEMCNYFHRIGKAVKEDNASNKESNLAILINELLLCILQMFRSGKISLDKGLVESMRSAELFLNELPSHLDREWTLESMAEYCGLGTTRFVHYCKKIKNMTPVQYLNTLRLKIAAEKLEKSPDMNISHIAYDCGFTSSQYFATTFKKHFGFTPKIYREHISQD